MKKSILLVVLSLLVAACGDDTSTVTTGAPSTTATTAAAVSSSSPATTTTIAPTTTTEPTGFTSNDLMEAVLADGDPWVVPIAGVTPIDLSIDDIWPLEGTLTFPDEHAIYANAGFVAGSFGAFSEPDGSAIVLTGAHLFEDATGAGVALDMITQSFSDTELVAAITGLAPGSLNLIFPMPLPDIGDDGSGVLLSGPAAQVIGYVWVTDNLLQFVRIGTVLGDEDRATAAVGLARTLAARTGS